MSTKVSSKITEVINELSPNFDVRISNDYSGRFMFGELCWSVSGSYSNVEDFLTELTIECTERKIRGIKKILKSRKQDQLGKGIVIYFPGYIL